jgi:hypothetical protein
MKSNKQQLTLTRKQDKATNVTKYLTNQQPTIKTLRNITKRKLGILQHTKECHLLAIRGQKGMLACSKLSSYLANMAGGNTTNPGKQTAYFCLLTRTGLLFQKAYINTNSALTSVDFTHSKRLSLVPY